MNKEIRDIIMESVNKILKEGIVVDTYDNVTMTDKHEKLVDTSVENNPTLLKDFVKDINVWSVFKRKDDERSIKINKFLAEMGVSIQFHPHYGMIIVDEKS